MTSLLALFFVARVFAAGETLQYNLQWLAISGGTMTMSIAPEGSNLHITSVAESNKSFAKIYSVRDEIDSIVSAADFSTQRYTKHLSEGGKHKDDSTFIDESTKTATRKRPNKDPQEVTVPKPVFDPLSLVYHIRELDLTPGKVHRFSVFADGKVDTLEAQVTSRETIDTPAGKFNTIAVVPKMLGGGIFRDEDSKMTIWYSDDARHIPVRIRSELKFGSIIATLREVKINTH